MPGLPLAFYSPGRRGEEKMRKKVNEKAMLEQKKNEALGFYRQLIERGLKPFEGASIDFHRKRDPVVFIPRERRQ
jgi:hypothetical protein